MKLKHLIRFVNATLALALIAGVSHWTSAQETRPRQTQPAYAEQTWTIPPDTIISVQINGTLTSRTAHVGDKFTATVTVPVYVNGRTVIPAGAIIEGRVTQVTPAKRMNRSGTIAIDFDDIVFPNGASVGLVGSLTSDDPETRRRIDDESRVSAQGNKRPAVFVGGGGAIGAVLGGIAGGGKGAAVGGAVGAGAGIASILLSKGEEAQVPSGTPFGVQIKQALVIRESYFSEATPAGDQSPDPLPDRLPDRRQDRIDRPEPAQPDSPERSIPERAEPESQPEVDRSTPSLPDQPLSSPEMVRRAQGALKEQGYYEGAVDGVMSPRTSGALRAYQREHNLQETGDLDPPTAQRLGILGAPKAERTPERPRDTKTERTPERPRETRTESAASSDSVMANVISASANRTPAGAISVLINTQANTGGWRWFGEQVVNGDTLEVYARAVRPTGMVTQALTRGRIELTVRDGVEYVRQVIIHSAAGEQVISLGGRASAASVEPRQPSGPSAAPVEPRQPSGASAASANSLQRKAEDLLSEYQRVYGVRMTGTGVEVDNPSQYREAEIELLFAIDSFANAAQLYARLATSLRDRNSLRGATLAMAREARRTDRVISTTNSRAADALAARWDPIRQDVLKLMQAHNINSSEIED
jgi:peptidoglycan hydrolase-like protein with peptidoglycan-binding domain